MITAVLDDRSLELPAETPYRQAAKETFRHFGVSEGTVKIYAGGRHVKSFHAGGWRGALSSETLPAGLVLQQDGKVVKDKNTWVELWRGQVYSRGGVTKSSTTHTYIMFMKLPESTNILVVRVRGNGGAETSNNYKHKVVRYEQVQADTTRKTLQIERDTFRMADDKPADFPALHSLMNDIFRHKNLLNPTTIVSLRADEMKKVKEKYPDDEKLQKIIQVFKDTRYEWTPNTGDLNIYNPRILYEETAPLTINCPFSTKVKVTEEGLKSCHSATEEGLLPWFSGMFDDQFRQLNQHRHLARPTEITDIMFNKGAKQRNLIRIHYDHGNISLGWTKTGQLFLRHNDLGEDANGQDFQQRGKIPWVDQAFTENWTRMLDARRTMIERLNKRHTLYLDLRKQYEEKTNPDASTHVMTKHGPYRTNSSMTILNVGTNPNDMTNLICDVAIKKQRPTNVVTIPKHALLLHAYEQAVYMNPDSIALALAFVLGRVPAEPARDSDDQTTEEAGGKIETSEQEKKNAQSTASA